jgi:polysaccharide pyruvyl transferase WcaK-like protein
MKILVSGWFSFDNMGTTAGDVIACQLVCNWLRKNNLDFDIASRQQDLKGIKWEDAIPERYTHVIFICGPFGNGWPVTEFLDYLKNSKLIGLNLTILQSLEKWNPFDFLIERDSDRQHNPDITFGAKIQKAPVVGVIRAHKQKEYGKRAKHENANEAIDQLINSREMAIVNIDTSLENNQFGLRTSNEIESVIAKTDVIITTRLHGLVLALKNGVPALAIDPISGGAKITHQADAISWPYKFDVDSLKQQPLINAFEECLNGKAQNQVNKSVGLAKEMINKIENELKEYLLKQKGVKFQVV